MGEQLGRSTIGIELNAERAALIRGRVGPRSRIIEADARRIAELNLGPLELCLTSPPYMTAVEHPHNPLTAYSTLDGRYSTYLAQLTDIFRELTRLLRVGGHLVINAANIRTGDHVTPLAWDIAHALTPYLSFRGETYLRWDRQPTSFSGDYCMTFQRT